MIKKSALWLSLVLASAASWAVSATEVNQNLVDLMGKINQIDQDLQKKQSMQKNLNGAISDSSDALAQSNKLLLQLKQQKNISESQLNEIKRSLPEVQASTNQVQENVKVAIIKIYTQLKVLENSSDSVLSLEDNVQSKRKTQYLIKILKCEQSKYQNLQIKLNELNQANIKLADQLQKLDQDLQKRIKQQEQLRLSKQNELRQAQALNTQIEREQQQLDTLKKNRAELNRLLSVIAATEMDTNTNQAGQARGSVKPPKVEGENNSPFFKRTLAKPLNASVAVTYGANRHGLRNNGVLYSATNLPVFSISSGKVMYSGELAGFGQVVVIDHGDNYMSVYGGIINSTVTRGQSVTVGQQIASSGNTSNQPQGGVYFELRHFGRPVNPMDLINS